MMNDDYKDRGLRQALERKNQAAEQMKLSEDFADRLMDRIGVQEQKPTTTSRAAWLYAAVGAIAASVILLLTFHLLCDKETVHAEQPVVAKQTVTPDRPVEAVEQAPVTLVAQESTVADRGSVTRRHSTATTATTATAQHPAASMTDSLDYYIDKIERELAQVDESLYIERMNKVILADDRLQRIVNSYILHKLDKEGRPQVADNMFNVKTEQHEE